MTQRYGTRRSPGVLAGTALVVLGALAGCGAGSRPASSPETQQSPAMSAEPGAGAAEGAPSEDASESKSDGFAPPPASPAAPAAQGMPGSTRGEAEEEGGEYIDKLDRELASALSLSAPDCTLAASLRDRICDLAGHLCRLSQNNPGEPEIADRCRDGQGRCDGARRRYGASCGE